MSETTERTATPTKADFEAGTWQATLKEAATLYNRAEKATAKAGQRLWDGAQIAISSFADDHSEDENGEALYNDLLDVMGTAQKGSASKIKTVALAVVNHGLTMSEYPSLSKAYAAATHLTKTVKEQAVEDDAAEKAIEAINSSGDVPNSTTTVEGAALLLFSKGMDGAVKAIFDALNVGGVPNPEAHRAFLREANVESAARVKAAKDEDKRKAEEEREKARAEKAEAKAKAEAEKPKAEAKKAVAKKAPAKAKAKAEPKSVSKGDPNKRPLPAKKAVAAKPAAKKPVVKG